MKIVGLNFKQVAYNRKKYGMNIVPGVHLKSA